MSIPPEIPPVPDSPISSALGLPLGWLLAPGRGWFRALRHTEFRVFWAGNFVSNIGSWMQNVAQGWLVLTLPGGSPFWLGLVGFAQQVPALIFSLPGGVIADRPGRRKMLMTTQTAMMLLAFLLAVLISLKWITIERIAVIAFFAGTTMALNAPSYQAALCDLVEQEDTLNAIALNSIQFNMSRVLGPALAGFTIAGLSIETCFYLNALSYVPLIYVLGRTRFPEREERAANSWRGDLAEGFRYIRTHRTILLLIIIVAMVSMFGLPYIVMMPEFAKNVLVVGPRGLGYLMGAAGFGALLGGVHLASMKPHRRRGPLVLFSATLFFTAILLFCVSRQPLLSMFLLAVAGAAVVGSVATVNSLIQTLVPDGIRGRVLSMHSMAFLGFTPLGSLLIGLLSELWGAPTALAASSGFALVLMAGISLTARDVRELQ
jgi:MFS family permease